ncbi:MAG: zinc-binding domain-containing protein, partial [Candidatus Omnitrophica bacterium]|nr:zinc-binding domain-containing protein [Candidatus Omnitrophota bacterium]
MDGYPISPNVKLRYICYLMATNKYSRELVKTTSFWNEHFLNTIINFSAVWKGCKISYIDGYTRSIHYLLVHKALYTRSRLSHFVPGMSDFCKVCHAQRETIIHAFLECKRATDAWQKLEPIFLRITGENLNDIVRI